MNHDVFNQSFDKINIYFIFVKIIDCDVIYLPNRDQIECDVDRPYV